VSATSVTFNGVTLTSSGTLLNGSDIKVQTFYLIAPASGTANIEVTLSGTADVTAGAVSYTGSHQTSPIGTPATATGSDDTPTVNVISATGQIVQDVLGVFAIAGPPFITVGGGQTERWNGSPGNVEVGGGGSTESGGASVTMSWSLDTSYPWALQAIPIRPTGAGSEALIPNGTSAAGHWVPSGAATLHECLDEGVDAADDDATYVHCNAGLGVATLDFTNPTLAGPFTSMTLRIRARKTTSGSVKFSVYLNGLSVLVGTITPVLTTAYATFEVEISGSWTAGDLNTLQVQLLEFNFPNDAHVSALEVVIDEAVASEFPMRPMMFGRNDSFLLAEM
jgi:hypothetical protein